MSGGVRSSEIERHLPYLRRYARAVTGDQRRGDRDVGLALSRLLRDHRGLAGDGLRLALYRALHEVWQRTAARAASTGTEDAGALIDAALVLQSRLHELAPPHRQALLLATLEGFPPEDVAAILNCTGAEVEAMLAEAAAELRSQPPSRVLVIEDEPVIALDIATMLEQNGHTVVGIAATRTEAVDLARASRPDLVLADIRLADESSGIDAVREILSDHEVPVVFVTAYPERLLTGARPEPTFLVTKPFDRDILDVTISQALATARRRGGAGSAA